MNESVRWLRYTARPMSPIPISERRPDAMQYAILAYEDPRFNGYSWNATCLNIYADELGPTLDASVRKLVGRMQREIADILAGRSSPMSAPREFWEAAMEVRAIPSSVPRIKNAKGQSVTLAIHTISFDRFRRLHEAVFGATHYVPIPEPSPSARFLQMPEDFSVRRGGGNGEKKSPTPGGRIEKELRPD